MIYVILPAYDEEKNLPPLLDGIRESLAGLGYKVIAVDDGSRDSTREVLSRAAGAMPVEVISHEVNKGLGAALGAALDYLSGKVASGDIVVTMDADNTHPPSLVPVMAGRISDGAGIVIASRFCRGGVTRGVPFYRNVLSRVAAIMFRVAFGIKGVRDYTSGYRAVAGDVIKAYFDSSVGPLVTTTGFEAGAMILIKLARGSGARVEEIPLDLRYDLKKGASKMNVAAAAAGYIKLLIEARK